MTKRTLIVALSAVASSGLMLGMAEPRHDASAIVAALLAQSPSADERQRAEERTSYLEFVEVAVEYVGEFDTVVLEADDAVRTCERSPADDAPKGGKPRFLDAQRARDKFSAELKQYGKAVEKLQNGAKAKMPADREDAVRAMARASKSDQKALGEVLEYLRSRGHDKHEEFAKARSKLNSVRSGPIAGLRINALRALGISTER